MFNPDTPLYDVVIAGAGPVGLFLACELRLAGLSVLALEEAEHPQSPLKRLPFGMRGLTVATLEACGNAVGALAARRRMAMVEPFISHRVDGRVRNELTAEAMIRAMTVAAGLGTTSAYTWLKVPVVSDMERVMAATTLPAVILGGEVGTDADAGKRAIGDGVP